MGKRVQWDVCKKNNILVPEKMVWAQTGTLWLRRGGQTLFIIDKVKKACQIVDFAVLYHTRVNVKETEKLEKYQIFFTKLKNSWSIKCRLFPWLLGGWEQRQRAYATEWKKLGLRPEHKNCRKSLSSIRLGSSGKFSKFQLVDRKPQGTIISLTILSMWKRLNNNGIFYFFIQL